MKNGVILLILGLGLSACTKTDTDQDGAATRDNKVNVPSEQNSEPQRGMYLVASNAIIVVLPDSEKVDSLRYVGKQVLLSKDGADLTRVRAYAEANQIKLIEFKDEVVSFKKADGSEKKLAKKDMIGDVVLFNVNKEPFDLTAVSFSTKDADLYFKN